jgi:TonB-dependent receptor-like protein
MDGGGDQRTIRFAGRARDDNNFNFDGVDAGGIQEQAQKSQTRLQISEAAVEEYRVSSALYDAEYGTQAGGQVNIVTKSGTNSFHGTAFGFIRNSVFDARNFNDPPHVPPFRMGQYGFSIGGPIVKDKTFFFANYEGLRQFQATTAIAAVPTPKLLNEVLVTGRNGAGPSPQMCSILQAYPWQPSTGTVGTCAPRFTFPDSFFSPLSPDLSSPDSGDAQNFTRAFPTTVHEDTWLVRSDHKISDKTTLYGRAQRDISLVDAPNKLQDGLDLLRTINHPANYFVALQHVFSPNVVNETKLFINRSPFHNPQSSTLPYSVATPNFYQINNNQSDVEVGTTYGVIDNLTWTHGRHAFKAGLEIRRVRLNQGKTASNNLTFSGNDDSLVSATLSQVQFTAPWCCHKFRRTFYMPYFQDEWKVTPTLTLTAGLRWEYYGVAHEGDNATTVFDLDQFHGVCLGSGSTNIAPSPGPINTLPCPRNPVLYNANYLNFDPRLGVAWAPRRLNGKTVIRAGFGIYHGAAQNDDLNSGLESDTFTGTLQGSFPLHPAFQQTVPDLSGFSNAGNAPRALQRQGRRDLYAEEWGLTIDHELPASFLFSLSYLGTHGVRLFSRGGENFCITTPDVNGNCTRALDPFYPGGDPFASVDIKRDIGSSSYNAFLASLERRFNNGLSFQARYTWSHSINNGSVGGGESNGPENVNCLQCDNGPSVFDIRHNIAVNGLYELPFGLGKTYLNNGGPSGKVIGGWKLSGIGLWHTGHPLTVLYNVQPSQLPDGNDITDQRPDVIPGVPLTLPGGGKNGLPLINPAAFQAPPQNLDPAAFAGSVLRFGNEPRGATRALHYWQIDMALMKETRLTERLVLEFGVQAFNIFNHVQLGDPSNLKLDYVPNPAGPGFITQAGSNFGVITGTVNFNNNNDNAASPNTGTGLPRQLQFMVRFKF